jgi:hypothetical protein
MTLDNKPTSVLAKIEIVLAEIENTHYYFVNKRVDDGGSSRV